jgi:exosortase A
MSGSMAAPTTGMPARAWLPWAALLLALLALFHETGASMVAIWIRSETYTHAFLVPVISGWLAWRRRDQLAGLPIRPVPWLLLPIALVCLAWLAGELAAVQSATHFALVALVVLSVPAVLGWAVARALTFPLLFLFFAVPFGEFMVPQLMEWTADFTVLALQWTGIPVYRDGLQFVIPSGNWSVVEACSGIRYLIASFMVGSLFAYLNYRSPWRRAAFIGVSLAVPLVANWLRAYMIVMLGHLSGNKIAAGVDHLIYGWLFFGVVIALMFVVGARWTERDDEFRSGAAVNGDRGPGQAAPSGRAAWTQALAALLLCGMFYAYLLKLNDGQPVGQPSIVLSDRLSGGWIGGELDSNAWRPAYKGPTAVLARKFSREERDIGVWIAYYRNQRDDRKLVTTTNTLVDVKDPRWSLTRHRAVSTSIGTRELTWRTAELRDANPLEGNNTRALAVWRIYWIGGRWISGDAAAKLWTAWDQLRGRGDDGAVLMLFTSPTAGYETGLSMLSAVLLPEVEVALEHAKATR